MRIQNVQNSCVRYIFGIRKYDSVTYKLKDLRWLRMKNYRELLLQGFYHTILYARLSSCLYEKIT
nr:unnamed protein product [Callosobruchus chinensis]